VNELSIIDENLKETLTQSLNTSLNLRTSAEIRTQEVLNRDSLALEASLTLVKIFEKLEVKVKAEVNAIVCNLLLVSNTSKNKN
jgi:hypothetical protein